MGYPKVHEHPQDSGIVTAPPPFSEAAARSALEDACRQAGLGAAGARLLRMGENALYRLLDAPVVVRIARSAALLPDARKEVAVARWLASAGLPAVRLVGDLEQPMMATGLPVTFWEFVDEVEPAPSLGDLGGMLRRLHAVDRPSWVELPPFDPFGRVPERLEATDDVSPADVAFLCDRAEALRQEYERLAFELAPGHIHGDAHTGNLMRASDGVILLLDFERFTVGPREWDLIEPAVEHFRLGWETSASYREFASAYGYDVTDWPGSRVLADIKELAMTTWLMQNIRHDRAIDREFRHRVESLKGLTGRNWRPF